MSTCLNDADFERVDVGQVDDAAAGQVRAHLDSCRTCREAYERFQHDQAFLARARSLLSDRADSVATVAPPGTSVAAKQDRHFPRIDGYRIIEVLGQGGMGIVYRALQTKLKRTVALKVLPAVIGSASPSAVSRFRREAHAAARLHHTHIIPIYDFGESHGGYFYAMELITGQPLNVLVRRFAEQNAASASPARLAELLRQATMATSDGSSLDVRNGQPATDSYADVTSPAKGRLYYQQVARWMADAADALQYAHGEGIVHRDIKPANLILSIDGRVMICDFGLAKSAGEDTLTVTGSLLGTVRYLSPEQAMARRIPHDHRTDIYSLGATMYEMLTFQPAFPGDDDKQILSAIITRDPAPLRKIVHSVPPELETICLKTLEKSPDARYDTARAMAEDLRRYINDLPIAAKRPGPVRRALKFVRRRKAPVAAVTAVLLLIVTSIGLILGEKRRVAAQIVAQVNIGAELLKNEDLDGAQAAFGKVLALDPDDFQGLANMALVRKEQYFARPLLARDRKLLEESVVFSERALSIRKDHPALWNLRGAVLFELGRLVEAKEALERALQLAPEFYWAATILARVLAMQGHVNEALETALTVSRMNKLDDGFYGSAGAWRTLGAIQQFLGDPACEVSFTKALQSHNSDEGTWLLRARFHLARGGPKHRREALRCAQNAEDFDPADDGRIKRIRALAHLRNEEFPEAIIHAREAIKVGDMPTSNHLIVAIAKAHLGDMQAARSELETADRAWPADLKEAGTYSATAFRGILWFETSDELYRLRAEAERLVGQTADLDAS